MSTDISSALDGDDGRHRERMMSRESVASVLDVSEDTIDRLIRDGDLIAYKIRGQVRIWPHDLDGYLRAHRWGGAE
jgi:excisionase family DNA binding protein